MSYFIYKKGEKIIIKFRGLNHCYTVMSKLTRTPGDKFF